MLCLLTIIVSCIETIVDPCRLDCPLEELCVGCDLDWLVYTVIGLTAAITLFFLAPVGFLCIIQARNFMLNKTSNERFARSARTQSAVSELDSVSSYEKGGAGGNDNDSQISGSAADGNRGDRGERREATTGCLGNCFEMCCNKKIVS